jgi:hypothetical protein
VSGMEIGASLGGAVGKKCMRRGIPTQRRRGTEERRGGERGKARLEAAPPEGGAERAGGGR